MTNTPRSTSQVTSLTALSDPKLGYKGMSLILSDKIKEADKLFTKHLHKFVQMRMGNFFLHFLNALMTFEDEQIAHAMKVMKEMESLCSHDVKTLNNMVKPIIESDDKIWTVQEIRLENSIIIADIEVCKAMLTFVNQDLGSYLKGGWMLRKAFKIYEKSYREVKRFYDSRFPNEATASGSKSKKIPSATNVKFEEPVPDMSSSSIAGPSTSTSRSRKSDRFPSRKSSTASTSSSRSSRAKRSHSTSSDVTMSTDVVAQLMCAVSYGFGCLQLGISFLPANLIKVVHFLGFEGDREVGLKMLNFATKGTDMRAPLAILTLIWYNTILRAYFAADGPDVRAGVTEAVALLEKANPEYRSSTIFSFFQGRVHRLKGNLDDAIVSYNSVIERNAQRELQILTRHEIGWCYLLQFKWEDCKQAFKRVKKDSRWGKSFYGYLVALCMGSSGAIEEAKAAFREIPSLIQKHNNPLEQFVLRRSQHLCNDVLTKNIMTLYVLEIIALWQSLSTCPASVQAEIVTVLNKITQPELLPMRYFVEGSLYAAQKKKSPAIEALKKSIDLCNDKNEQHIAAHSSYEWAMLLIQDPKTISEAEALLRHIKDTYTNCDFQNRMAMKVHSTLKSIAESKK